MKLGYEFRHNWHPCSQMKDYETFPNLRVQKANGCYLYTHQKQKVLDIISSWWCKPLGHQHPLIKEAVMGQMNKFEHVIFANTTSDLAIELGNKITQLASGLDKVFYACDGSTAVEIALKMSLQYHLQSGSKHKNKFAYFSNAYHGETILCYSVSDLELYQSQYKSLVKKQYKLTPPTYLQGRLPKNNILDINNSWKKEIKWKKIEESLNEIKTLLSAIIVEPIVQGAAGMLMYSADLLHQLSLWCSKNRVHLIVDEIMTGFGRLGKKFAYEYANITPDFVCAMKGLGGGWTPFSVVLTKSEIYQAFYDDYQTGKAFMHSNTYSGYSLGMAAANAIIDILEQENWYSLVLEKGIILYKAMVTINEKVECLKNIRQIGFIAAAEIDINYFEVKKNNIKENRLGYLIYQEALKLGVLLRPLGNTIYFLPPFIISELDIELAVEKIIQAIQKVKNQS